MPEKKFISLFLKGDEHCSKEAKDIALAILSLYGAEIFLEPKDKVVETSLPIETTEKDLADLKADLKKIKWTFKSKVIENIDWAKEFRKSFKPVPIKPFKIYPSWIKDIPKIKDEYPLILYPAQAFGTGTHSTTKLCLKAIYNLKKSHKKYKSLLDVGTGSGVLAIGAGLINFKNIKGTDIDPLAIKEARKNTKLNKKIDKINISYTTTSIEKVKDNYDIVVANILANDLINMRDFLKNRLNKNSHLILSGILKEEAKKVIKAFRDIDLKFIKQNNDKEWCALIFTNNLTSIIKDK